MVSADKKKNFTMKKIQRRLSLICMYEPRKYSEVASNLMLYESTYYRKKIVLPLVVNGLLIEKKDNGITQLLSNREKVKKGRDILLMDAARTQEKLWS